MFGTLCALDPEPREIDESVLRTFRLHADLIGHHMRAQRAARERENFMAVLAHDLRTPLSTASLVASALGELPAPANALAPRLSRTVARMQRIVDDATDVARGRMGRRMPLSPTPLNAGKMLRTLLHDYAEPGDVELQVEGDLAVCWDRTRVEQLVTNLLANALQYRDETEPVRVRLSDDGDEIELEVSNVGDPIPDDLLPVLFDPFHRGDKFSRHGLGLGLFVVKSVANAHGGDVCVYSDDARTRFVVSLLRDASISSSPSK
ncbi:MAG: HAMP domain-containing histidine kinase [bacterium]|nr:HAMP domain-containing histidine kinase [bacterium]